MRSMFIYFLFFFLQHKTLYDMRISDWSSDVCSSDLVTEALKAFGVAAKDLQTRQLTVNRIDWGANKGKYEAVNQVEVRMRAVDKAGEAVAATTRAGANVLSGPTLRVSDQEAATKSAYAAAYRAARGRAEAYAGAAGLTR